MKKNAIRVVLTVFLLTTAMVVIAQGPIKPPELEWAPGQILIKLNPDVHPGPPDHANGPPSFSKAFNALNKKNDAAHAKSMFPHYNSTAVEALSKRPAQAQGRGPEMALKKGLGRWMLLEVEPGADIEVLVKEYAALPEVELAEPNYLFRLTDAVPDTTLRPSRASTPSTEAAVIPNDPDFGLQWGLDYIDAPEAWDITMGDPSQVIAIIDTGVDLDHPDLASKIWTNPNELVGDANNDGCPGLCGVDDDGDGLTDEGEIADDDENGYVDDFNGWDWVSNGEGFEDNDPQDDNGHGTHVAGIAAAATDNGIGMAGVCPLCKIMPLKAFQSSGTAGFSDIAKAIDYAWRNDATVINMSFGSFGDSSLVKDALSLASSKASLIAAAGNSGVERYAPADDTCSTLVAPFYPAHYDFVIGVEAAIADGDLAGFSNCEYELRNPGNGIYSTVFDDSYATWAGTSMAAPMVAGTAALLQAYHEGDPAWGPELVFGQLIKSSANSLSALVDVPEPDLRYIDYEVIDDCPSCNGDGRADSGETIKIVVNVRNLWGEATGVTGTLSTDNAQATISDGLADWSTISPAAFADNSDNPFVLDIALSAENNEEIVLDLEILAGNGGVGIFQQISLVIQRVLEKSGFISSDETWTSDYEYLVTNHLIIESGARLTIEPGTIVKVAPSRGFIVRGELVARGTPSQRITFTSSQEQNFTFDLRDSTGSVFDAEGDYLSGTICEYCIGDFSNVDQWVFLEFGAAYITKSILFLHQNRCPSTDAPLVGNVILSEGFAVSGSPSKVIGNTVLTGSRSFNYTPPSWRSQKQ